MGCSIIFSCKSSAVAIMDDRVFMLHRSKAHFQQALSSSLLGRKEATPVSTTDDGADKPQKRVHPCPRADCPKEYKQLSGLRYHLAHVSTWEDFLLLSKLTTSSFRVTGKRRFPLNWT